MTYPRMNKFDASPARLAALKSTLALTFHKAYTIDGFDISVHDYILDSMYIKRCWKPTFRKYEESDSLILARSVFDVELTGRQPFGYAIVDRVNSVFKDCALNTTILRLWIDFFYNDSLNLEIIEINDANTV